MSFNTIALRWKRTDLGESSSGPKDKAACFQTTSHSLLVAEEGLEPSSPISVQDSVDYRAQVCL